MERSVRNTVLWAGLLAGCTHPTLSDLDGVCERSWSPDLSPEEECAAEMVAHLGMDPNDPDATTAAEAMWVLARAPMPDIDRAWVYNSVARIRRLSHGAPGIDSIGRATVPLKQNTSTAVRFLVHEGLHTVLGDHDLPEQQYDTSDSGVYGTTGKVCDAIARGIELSWPSHSDLEYEYRNHSIQEYDRVRR